MKNECWICVIHTCQYKIWRHVISVGTHWHTPRAQNFHLRRDPIMSPFDCYFYNPRIQTDINLTAQKINDSHLYNILAQYLFELSALSTWSLKYWSGVYLTHKDPRFGLIRLYQVSTRLTETSKIPTFHGSAYLINKVLHFDISHHHHKVLRRGKADKPVTKAPHNEGTYVVVGANVGSDVGEVVLVIVDGACVVGANVGNLVGL